MGRPACVNVWPNLARCWPRFAWSWQHVARFRRIQATFGLRHMTAARSRAVRLWGRRVRAGGRLRSKSTNLARAAFDQGWAELDQIWADFDRQAPLAIGLNSTNSRLPALDSANFTLGSTECGVDPMSADPGQILVEVDQIRPKFDQTWVTSTNSEVATLTC